MWTEGHFVGEPTIPPELLTACLGAIDLVTEAGAPPLAALAFDAPWEVQTLLGDYAEAALDGAALLLPATWIWKLTADEPRGWEPHRDRPRCEVDDRGAPMAISLWVALTDATPENGCMYVLPANLDIQYRNPRATPHALSMQHIRALPARAGSVLGWTSPLLHWGGTAKAGVPGRASIAFEFQSARYPPTDEQSFPRGWFPTAAERRALIDLHWRQYLHMHESPPDRRQRLTAVLDALGLT
jgi:ectoine hydroxylase-related dioxygenase (phytanoyl-CoA dioxygenase family)